MNSWRSALRAVWRCCSVFVLLSGTPALFAQSADDGFNVTVDGFVTSAVVQPDGKILIGGDFTTVNGSPRKYLARLFVDGSLDTDFVDAGVNAGIKDGAVYGIALQADGRILIGGAFTQIGNQTRMHIARLNAAGTVDASYNPGANASVNTMALQRDGRLLIGGDFTTVGAANESHPYLARIGTDGSPDSSYPPAGKEPDQPVASIALQADGKAVIGGAFDLVGAQALSHLARLRVDGTVDNTFTPPGPVDGIVRSVAAQLDGKVLVGGAFSMLGVASRGNLARLNQDGTLDGFAPNPDSPVFCFAFQPDGSLLVGGDFFNIAGQPVNKIARFNVDDTLDAQFRPPYTSATFITTSSRALAVQPDGRIVAGGTYASFDGRFSAVGRLNGDGSVDRTFTTYTGTNPPSIVEQADGKILIGGNSTKLNGVPTTQPFLTRLDAAGDLDVSFGVHADSSVNAVAVQPDGRIVVGGFFTTFDNGAAARRRVVRLDDDGQVDPSFDPDADNVVFASAIQADGKIVIGGGFTTLAAGTATRRRIARVDAQGNVDGAFDPDADGIVYSLAIQPDGKVVIGGAFTTLKGGAVTRHFVARLNVDGSVDGTFDPDPDNVVRSIVVQPDGGIILGGAFTTFKGGAISRRYLARLSANGDPVGSFNPDPDAGVSTLVQMVDGRILAGGSFATFNDGTKARPYLARLNADGSIDDTFDAQANYFVNALYVAHDGRILASGGFGEIGGENRISLARLSTRQPAQQSLRVNGADVSWFRGGAGAEPALPPRLYVSVDGSSYDLLGPMERTPGGWRFRGLPAQPTGSIFYLRALASIDGAQYHSQGLIEHTRQFVGDDRIFGDNFDPVF